MTADARPIGRFEWERLVRRIIMPAPQKLVAFVLASYADPNGSRVRPGLDVLVDVTGLSNRTIKRIMAALLDLQLLELVSRGGGRGGAGKAAEYRLTLPMDLLDRAELLTPNGRAERPIPPDSEATQMAHQSGESTVDNDHSTVDNPPEPVSARTNEGPNNTVTKPLRGQIRQLRGHPDGPLPTTSPTTLTTTPMGTNQRNSRPRARTREPPRRVSTIHSRHSRKDSSDTTARLHRHRNHRRPPRATALGNRHHPPRTQRARANLGRPNR